MSSKPPPKQSSLYNPLLGFVGFTAALVAVCTLPAHFMLRKRLVQLDASLSHIIASNTRARKELILTWNKEAQLLRTQLEALQGRVDGAAADTKHVKTVLPEERTRYEVLNSHLESLR